MTMPWRQFNFFDFCGLYGYDTTPGGTVFDQQANWNAGHLGTIINGDGKLAAPAGAMVTYQGLFRPYDSSFRSQTSLDHPAFVKFEMTISAPSTNTAGVGTFEFNHGSFDSPPPPTGWDRSLSTGQEYDGINAWADFPLRENVALGGFGINFSDTVTVANLPKNHCVYAPAWTAVANNFGLPRMRDYWYANGWFWRLSNYDIGVPTGWGNGDEFYVNLDLNYVTVKYFDPVVNSFSRYWMKPAGGVAVVLSGLGFENSDADIEEGGNANPNPWNDDVN